MLYPTRSLGSLRGIAVVALALTTVAAQAEDRDPLQLLRDSAAATGEAASASVDVVVSTTLVRNEESNDESMTFRYRTAPEGRFEFFTVAEEEGEAATYGYRVAGNGEVTLTALLGGDGHRQRVGRHGPRLPAPGRDGRARRERGGE